jgi:hypothetical protein
MPNPSPNSEKQPTMNTFIKDMTIPELINLFSQGERKAIIGYGDAEWCSLLDINLGTTTGLGQILDGVVGERLAEILILRKYDTNFLISPPVCMWQYDYGLYGTITEGIENFRETYNIRQTWYDRDLLTDAAAKKGELFPLISWLQNKSLVIIGNEALENLDFLSPQKFIPVPSPNCHLDPQAIKKAINQAIEEPHPDIFLVSAGISSCLLIDELYDLCPTSSFIDCGSIWDAFVGIGGQRGWRGELYKNPQALETWKRKNLDGC